MTGAPAMHREKHISGPGHVRGVDCWCEPVEILRFVDPRDDGAEDPIETVVIIHEDLPPRRLLDELRAQAPDWISRLLDAASRRLLPPHDPNERNPQ